MMMLQTAALPAAAAAFAVSACRYPCLRLRRCSEHHQTQQLPVLTLLLLLPPPLLLPLPQMSTLEAEVVGEPSNTAALSAYTVGAAAAMAAAAAAAADVHA
jgi:hypothetical protein